jgi:hypothetical protein
VTFQFFALGGPGQTSGDGEGSAFSVQKGTAIFDLACNLWQSATGIAGEIEYSTALFDAETIARLATLPGLARRHRRPPGSNPLPPAADLHGRKAAVVGGMESERFEIADNRRVHEWVEEHAHQCLAPSPSRRRGKRWRTAR